MGCAISGLAEAADFDGRAAATATLPAEQQIHLIQESWKVIRDDIAKVGIIVFVK